MNNNNRNAIYAGLGLFILFAATSLAIWYAYLTKQKVENNQGKTFDPLVVQGGGGSESGAFSNDTVTEKGFADATKKGGSNSQDISGSLDSENNDGNGQGENGTAVLGPDGKPVPGSSPEQNGITSEKKVPKLHLFKLYEGPVAGYDTYTKEGKLVVRLVERQKGNIIDIPLKTQKAERVTNETIVGVQKAYFTNAATHVVIQHLDEDDSVLTLSSPVTELAAQKDDAAALGTQIGTYLPVHIQGIALRDNSIFFLSGQEDGSVQLISTNLQGEKSKRLWKSPIQGWNMYWSSAEKGSIVLNQKPALKTPGYAYRLQTTTGVVSKMFGDEPALSTVENRTGTELLKSTVDEDGILRSELVVNTKKNNLKVGLIPEKCAWGDSSVSYLICGVPTEMIPNTYPDPWFRGGHRYMDTIMKVDKKNGATEEIMFTDKAIEGGLDVTSPLFTSDGAFFFFIDKTTGTLWALSLI